MDEKDIVVVVFDVDVVIINDDDFVNLKVVNLDPSFHIISRCEFFISYTSDNFDNVRMENDRVTKIVGMEDVCLETNIGC